MSALTALSQAARSGRLVKLLDPVLLIFALAELVICAAMPVLNPDLFWHLSAGRRMLELHAIPSVDWLSHTLAGAPWVDFEWLVQLLYYGLYLAGGITALWGLKALLILAGAAILWKTLELYPVPKVWRVAALALWSACSIAHSDLRPDLFSGLLFSTLVLWLERRRLGKKIPNVLWMIPFFGAWVNLHAGFPYGFALIGIYALAETIPAIGGVSTIGARHVPGTSGGMRGRLRRHAGSLWAYIAVGLAATLLQPFGVGYYQLLWDHLRLLDPIKEHIIEWGEIAMDNPWYWPYWVLLFLSFGLAALHVLRRRPIPWGPIAGILFYGFLAARHERFASYFTWFAIPITVALAHSTGLAERKAARWAAACAVVAVSSFVAWAGTKNRTFHLVFRDRYVTETTARFLEQEKGELAGRPFYNEWGWGGYLGWRLFPTYYIFQDGRYIFHPFLDMHAAATLRPEFWQQFMDRYGIEVAVLPNKQMPITITRVFKDGSTREVPRPYFLVYMPRERWALVHWDDKAVVLVRRDAVDKKWLAKHEFKLARPFDADAIDDGIRRGEMDRKQLKTEIARHAAERAALDGLAARH